MSAMLKLLLLLLLLFLNETSGLQEHLLIKDTCATPIIVGCLQATTRPPRPSHPTVPEE